MKTCSNELARCMLAAISLSGIAFGILQQVATAQEFRLVAGTDMLAPGDFGDRQFREFLLADIDERGQVVFGADVTTGAGGQASGIWAGNHLGLALVARDLSFAPGVPGIRFGSVEITSGEGVLHDANGNLMFKGVLANGTGVSDANRRGIWFGVPGTTLAPILRIGQQAPGAPAGAVFGDYLLEVAMNGAGRVAFSSLLVPGAGGVTSTNRVGIWANHSGSFQLVAREGNAAPGVPGRTFAPVVTASGFDSLVMADNGDLAFVGRLDNERRGIWLGPPSDLRPVMLEGTPAPGVEAGALFNITSNNDLYPDFALSAGGRIAFSFRLRDGLGGVSDANSHVLWAGRPGQLAVVARKGVQAPGMPVGTVFGFEGNNENPFRFAAVNESQIAFGGYVEGPGVNSNTNSGLWFGEVGALQLLAREGDPAPGAAAGVVFGDLWQASPQLNASGKLIFNANVRGPGISSQSNNSLWAFDETEGLQLLGYESQQVAIGSPFIREIASIGAFGGGRASNGGRTGLTGNDLVLASIRYRDGNRAIATLDLNEPGGQSPVVETLIAAGASWKYRDDGSDLGVAWRAKDYNDADWVEGPAQLGYGDDDEVTIVNCGPTFPQCNANNYATTYFRHAFDLADLGIHDPQRIVGLTAQLVLDDAAAVYLNGVEVVRSGSLSPTAAFNTFATTSSSDDEVAIFAIEPALLLPGQNVFAVEMHQATASSSDISFDFELTALVEPVPEPSAAALAVALVAAVCARSVTLYRQRLVCPPRGG